MSCNVLISSAGRRVSLLRSFRDALRAAGLDGRVIATDASRASSAFHEADDGVVVPRCASDDFVPAMLDVCAEQDIRLVVPTIDPELPVLAAHRAEFRARGVVVAVSDPGTVAIGSDKVLTHDWLVAEGFPTVQQTDPATVRSAPERWPFPLIVKPRRGSASIGVAVVADLEELDVATRRGDMVVQTVAAGHEYTVDAYVDASATVVEVIPRRRLEVRGGEVSKGVTANVPDGEELVRDLVGRLPGAFGALNVQLFRDDATGALAVIEVNAALRRRLPPRGGGRRGLPALAGGGGGRTSPLARSCAVARGRGDAPVRRRRLRRRGRGRTVTTTPPRCIVLDVDDTLYLERDYVRSGFDAVGEWAATTLGEDGVAAAAWEHFVGGQRGDVFDRILRERGIVLAPETIAAMVECYRCHAPRIELLPDAAELARLAGSVTFAVVTDGPVSSQRAKVEALGLERWADPVVLTGDLGTGYGKPHPKAFELVEAHLGTRGADNVYVADNPRKDFAGPRSLGWRTVRVRRDGSLHADVASGNDVDLEVADLSDLARLLGLDADARSDRGR